jgi:hypothetical protein
MGRREMHTGFWWGNLKERGHIEDPHVDERVILKWIVEEQNGRVWTGLRRLRMGTSGGLF